MHSEMMENEVSEIVLIGEAMDVETVLMVVLQALLVDVIEEVLIMGVLTVQYMIDTMEQEMTGITVLIMEDTEGKIEKYIYSEIGDY